MIVTRFFEIKKKILSKKEVILNKVLCGDMYQGVVKIVNQNGNNMKIINLEQKGRAL